ncbi:MAG: MFS transporter [Acidiferrobacterales bacterium]|nr:MFS transporter [Acidiferrobacterales bacterium]
MPSINSDKPDIDATESQNSGAPFPATSNKRKPQNGKLFLEMVVCILLPTLILKKLSGEDMLGTNWALVAALSLPIGMGIYDFISTRKIAFVPALGFISILLTGGIGLLQLPKEYIAFKEALIPLVLAIATLISTYTPYPLIKTFLYNDMVMDTDKVAAHLQHANKEAEFDQMMVKATWMLAGSFFLSAILNYILAKWIVVSETGTEAFNNELGTMNLMSYPVIVLPCMVITMFALFYVIRNINRLTGLGLEDVIHQ